MLVKIKFKVKVEIKVGVKVPLLQLQLWPRLRPSVVCLGGCWWPRGFMSLCELNQDFSKSSRMLFSIECYF